MTRKKIKKNLDKIRKSKELWKDFEYCERVKVSENEIKCIDDKNYLNRYALAMQLQYDFKQSDYELIRFLMENEIISRKKDSHQGCGNLLFIISYLLAKFRKAENVLLFQRAKDANFDTHCGYDGEFIFSAGIENIIKYIQNSPKNEKKILENEIDTSFVSYFTEEDIEDFIKNLERQFPSDESKLSIRSLFSDACTFGEMKEANRLFEILEDKEPENYQTLYYWAKDLKRYDKAIHYIKIEIEKTEEVWQKVSAMSTLIELYCEIKDFKNAYNTMLICEKYLHKVPSWKQTGLGRGLVNSWYIICLGFLKNDEEKYSEKSLKKADKMLKKLKTSNINYYLEKSKRCNLIFESMKENKVSLDEIILDSLDLVEKQVGEKYSKDLLKGDFLENNILDDREKKINILPKIIKDNYINKDLILIIEFIAHYPHCTALKFDSIEELEEYLLGGASYLNMFCTYAIPIVHGKVKDFDVYTQKGKKIVKYIFDEKSTKKNTENCTLKWL